MLFYDVTKLALKKVSGEVELTKPFVYSYDNASMMMMNVIFFSFSDDKCDQTCQPQHGWFGIKIYFIC